MKIFLKRISFLSLAFICWSTLITSAQIDSILILPKNPTVNDSVKIVVYTTFRSGGCDMITHIVNPPTINGTIHVEGCYNSGPLAVICRSIDTINIGKLSGGVFNVSYNLKRINPTTDPMNCPPNILDSRVMSFYVSSPNAVIGYEFGGSIYTVYPNPANESIRIDFINSSYEPNASVVFYNLLAQTIKKVTIENNHMVVDVSTLPSGTYFYRFETGTLTSDVKKISIIH